MSTLQGAPERRSHDRESRVVREAALELGLRASTVGSYVRARGIHYQVATIVRHARQSGDDKLAERLYAPIHLAYAGVDTPPLGDQLIHRVTVADLDEDMAESRYRANPSLANLRTWQDALRKQQSEHAVLIASIDAELRAS